jgi:hypothetical protein
MTDIDIYATCGKHVGLEEAVMLYGYPAGIDHENEAEVKRWKQWARSQQHPAFWIAAMHPECESSLTDEQIEPFRRLLAWSVRNMRNHNTRQRRRRT